LKSEVKLGRTRAGILLFLAVLIVHRVYIDLAALFPLCKMTLPLSPESHVYYSSNDFSQQNLNLGKSKFYYSINVLKCFLAISSSLINDNTKMDMQRFTNKK
jgi:hypothetical protein